MNTDTEDAIVWTGDLDDDCTALWAGLMLRAEWMDGPDWWWAVSENATGAEVASSNDDVRSCTRGTDARAYAETAARTYRKLKSHPTASAFLP